LALSPTPNLVLDLEFVDKHLGGGCPLLAKGRGKGFVLRGKDFPHRVFGEKALVEDPLSVRGVFLVSRVFSIRYKNSIVSCRAPLREILVVRLR